MNDLIERNMENSDKKLQATWRMEGYVYKSGRLHLGHSQKIVAAEIGVSPDTLSRFERGLPVQRGRLLAYAYRNYLWQYGDAIGTIPSETWEQIEAFMDDSFVNIMMDASELDKINTSINYIKAVATSKELRRVAWKIRESFHSVLDLMTPTADQEAA